jgi:type VI secretion system secreted protein VgrG
MKPTPFELLIEDLPRPLPVSAFRGRERMNAVDRFELTMPDPLSSTVDGQPLLGRRATLVVTGSSEGQRSFHGIITREDELASGNARLRLEPRMSLLRHAAMWRVFHDLDVLSVVGRVLSEHGVPLRANVVAAYPSKPLWTQRGESDLAFVMRILADAGIFFFFHHPQGSALDDGPIPTPQGDLLVLSDDPSGYLPHLRSRPFRAIAAHESVQPGDERVLLNHVSSRRLGPTRTVVVGRTFMRPISPEVADSAGTSLVPALPRMRTGLRYEHDGEREGAPILQDEARRRLEAAQKNAATSSATTICPHIAAGCLIDVASDLGAATERVVLDVRHEGTPTVSADTPTYRALLGLAPAATAARPRRSPRARLTGLETATVVGPPGKELHTDELGRVQVRFHWDLDGQAPTAWLRVTQAWAGAGYGATFLPRVGTEVLVGYLDGDPDQPAVVGCLHNPATPTSIRYPHDAEEVGIRTHSTPGGAGFSELTFSDRAGSERVSLRSQRTLSIESLGDAQVRHGRDLDVVVGGSRLERVQGDVATRTEGSERGLVAVDAKKEVGGNRSTSVAGDDLRAVRGAAVDTIGAVNLIEVTESRHARIGTGTQEATRSSLPRATFA